MLCCIACLWALAFGGIVLIRIVWVEGGVHKWVARGLGEWNGESLETLLAFYRSEDKAKVASAGDQLQYASLCGR